MRGTEGGGIVPNQAGSDGVLQIAEGKTGEQIMVIQ